jgi:hypothetical protein
VCCISARWWNGGVDGHAIRPFCRGSAHLIPFLWEKHIARCQRVITLHMHLQSLQVVSCVIRSTTSYSVGRNLIIISYCEKQLHTLQSRVCCVIFKLRACIVSIALHFQTGAINDKPTHYLLNLSAISKTLPTDFIILRVKIWCIWFYHILVDYFVSNILLTSN